MASPNADRVRAALQALLDELGDGYHVSQFVVCMGLERVYAGEIESTSWVWSPEDQPGWMTAGLLGEGLQLLNYSDTDDD